MKKATSVDEYIAGFPPGMQKLLLQMRATIRKAAPKAEESISYGIPAYMLEGRLVYFGGFKNHIGFYPRVSGISKFEKQLFVYKGAKGSVQFPADRPLPVALITAVVKFRVKENFEKAGLKIKKSAGKK